MANSNSNNDGECCALTPASLCKKCARSTTSLPVWPNLFCIDLINIEAFATREDPLFTSQLPSVLPDALGPFRADFAPTGHSAQYPGCLYRWSMVYNSP